ncbi:MAG: DUF3638 domain-containing protein [Candidatus Protochlamydia sp.]|nr:DUF3638 domain-containing protein [Candidatus Protochlamydia sp.]
MTDFDNNFYLSNLDKVSYYIKPPESDNKLIDFLTETKKYISQLFNYAFGDKHWYDNETAFKAVQHYIWQGKFNPEMDNKILGICQKLEASQISPNEKNQLTLAKKACSPLPNVTDRILFQLLGDEFGLGSELEGAKQVDIIEYFEKFISSRKELYHISDDLLDEIRTTMLLSFSLDSEKITEKVVEVIDENHQKIFYRDLPPDFVGKAHEKLKEAFKAEKSLLLPGGWIGKPSGHAMYYEVIPQKNGKANFRIYNLGSGTGEHQTTIINGKMKTAPYTEWKGIDQEKFLSAPFLLALYETKKLSEYKGESTDYNASDIYQGFRAFLNPEDEVEEAIELRMSGQKAGTCTCRSFLAFLATRMESQDYKKLVLDIDLHALTNRVAKNSIASQKEFNLIKKSHQHLSRKTQKAFKTNIIDKNTLQKDVEELSFVNKSIKSFKGTTTSPDLSLKPSYQKPHGTITEIGNQSISLHLQAEKKIEAPLPQPETKYFYQLKELLNKNIPLKVQLTQVANICEQALSNKGHEALELGMIEWALSLPNEPKNLSLAFDKNPKEMEKAITNLGQISESFFKNCFLISNSETIDPKRLYVLQKLLWAQMSLAHQIEPKWKVSASSLPTDDLLFNFFDPRMEKDNYLTKINTQYYHDFAMNLDYHSNKKQPIGKNAALEFTDKKKESYLAKDAAYLFPDVAPEIITKLTKQDSNFPIRPSFQQISRIYASDALPEWIKSIRNTHLSLIYLKNEPVGNPRKPNATLELEFHIDDRKDNSFVWVSVNGIDGSVQELYPVIKEIRKDSTERFAGMYRPFSSPQSKALFKALQNFAGYNSNEKKALCAEAVSHHLDMPDEDFRELMHIVTTTTMRKQEVLAFFQKYPEKLKDPDYQAIFKILMLNNANMQKIRPSETITSHLASFMKNSFTHYRAQNEIQTCTFLLNLSYQFSAYCPDEPFYKTALTELRNLLLKEGLKPEEKSILYAELIAQLAGKEKLERNEIKEILIGSAYLNQNPVPSRWEEPHIQKGVKDALIIHALQIEQEINQELLNELLYAVFPAAKKQEWKSSQSGGHLEFISSDETYRYAPLTGQLQAANEATPLPSGLREHPYFCKFFAEIREGVPLSDNIYGFKDQKGKETLVKLENDQLIIEQKHAGRWLKFIPPKQFIENVNENVSSVLISRELVHHYQHWQDLEDPAQLLMIDPSLDRAVYSAKLEENQIVEIRRLADGAYLGQSSNLLNNFEDRAYVQEWFDSQGNLIEIECPRFNLNFKYNAENQRLLCEQKKGYFLDASARIEYLGVFKHYLVLKNDQGKESVLIPKQKFYAPKEKEVLEPRFKIDLQLALENREKQSFLTYEVNARKELVSPNVEGNLYLAEVLSLVQEYDAAAIILLKRGVKLSAYSEEERKVLEDFINIHQITGDESGNALALRSFAGFCLLNNSLTYQKDLANGVFELVHENYHKYLEHLNHATSLKLKSSEEIFLLKILLSRRYDPLLSVRLKLLDPKYVQVIPEIEEKGFDQVKQFNPFEKININFPRKEKEIILFTRSGKAISQRLGDFFLVALKGTAKEKASLVNYLPFLQYENSGKYFGEALFLKTVLENPVEFTSPPPGEDSVLNDTLLNWKKETLVKAARLNQGVLPFNVKEKEITITAQVSPPQGKELKKESNTFTLSLTATPLFSNDVKSFFTINSENKKDVSVQEMQSLAKNVLKDISVTTPILEKNEWERIESDIHAYNTQEKPPTYQVLEKNSLHQLNIFLQNKKKSNDLLLKNEELDILAFANVKPTSIEEKNLEKLARWGKIKKVLTLEQLILYFGKKDLQGILKANPALNKAHAEKLMSMIGNYLLKATLSQQLERAEGVINEIAALTVDDAENIKNLTQKLASALPQAHRRYDPQKDPPYLAFEKTYDPEKDPAYLVFEYAANISLFPGQVASLEVFLGGGEANPVMEMIMGSGKSKVLLPLLGLLRADGEDLSMLIVPEPLFEDVSSGTQKILGEAFDQKLTTLHFDRNTTFSTVRLQTILDALQTVQKEKLCLIMTSKSVQCLILKYIEKCEDFFRQGGNEHFPEELKLMRSILTLLSTSGYPIIDEVDTLLSILHETSFSVGESTPPNKNDVKLIGLFYALIYSDPEIKNLANLESAAEINNGQPLTETVYNEKFKPLLAKKLLTSLATIEFDSLSLRQKVRSFVSTMDEKKEKLIIDYLCRNERNVDKAQEYFNTLDQEIQDLLALAGEELCHLLPHTLLKNSDEKYGLDEEKGGIIAIPFSAAKTPSRGSQFANAFITMNYTFQIYAKKGISHSIIENEIKRLQGEVMRELKEGGNQGVENTESWKLFSALRGTSNMPLFNYKPQELNTLVSLINSNLNQKQNFIQQNILPQLLLHNEKLSCNPLNLIAVLGKVIGFTGTLSNSKSMHRKLNPKPAIGTDAKTLSLLQKHSSGPVLSVKANTTEELLKELFEKGVQFNLIADAGGYCREWGNERIAKFLAVQGGQPVVFYNKGGQQVETDGKKIILLTESKTPPDQRRTFMDQAHTTGADVPQGLNAIGLVTIGENMLLRDLLQSVWRLRGLDKGQRVQFVVSDKVKGMINQELGRKEEEEVAYKEILKFVIHNQAKQQGKDNFAALKKELRSIPQMILLGVLMHSDIPLEQQKQVYTELRSTWIQPAAQRPRELFGKIALERETKFVVEEEMKQAASGLESLFIKFPWLEEKGFNKKEFENDVKSIIQRMQDSLPSIVVSPLSDDENTVEVEQELKAEEETQVEMEVHSEEKKKDLGLKRGRLVPVEILNEEIFAEASKQPYFTLKLFFEQDPSLKPYANAFKGIDLVLNVLQWPKENPQIKDLQLFGANRTPLHFVQINENGTSIKLLSQNEADENNESLYHLTHGIVNRNDERFLTAEVRKQIVQARFLNGDSHYSKAELELLRNWLKEEGVGKMRDLFKKQILSGFPNKAIQHSGSNLELLFKELST